MSLNRQQYERAAEQFFRQHPREFEKYFSPTLLQTLVNAMLTSLPTVTAAKITFDRLVASGALKRTDGKSDHDDHVAAVTAAQANLNKVVAEVDARPLTRDELSYFGSLSQRELSKLYWGDSGDGMTEFAVRYRKASREFGFALPLKFSASSADGTGTELTAAQYKAMPARELQIKFRNPQFKLQVMQLIKSGEI